MSKPGRFIVAIEMPTMRNTVTFFLDEKEIPMRFQTAVEAREAVRGAMWQDKWVWWVVELAIEGEVQFGPDVK